MPDSVAADLAGAVLAAGAGTRLRPLSLERPKSLCPVDNVPLVDLAIDRVVPAVGDAGGVAVNVHHGRAALEAHLEHRNRQVHVSVEEERALGTAGALGQMRSWLDGRGVVVVNADAWCPGSIAPLTDGWDGETVRVLVVGEDGLGPRSAMAGSLIPWAVVRRLEAAPSGLYEVCWRPAQEAGRLEVVRHDGPFVDCGTPADYLRANLTASGGRSIVGAGARVDGVVERTVVWPGARVHPGERLADAVRTTAGRTVLIR